jgi:hypothetical protein
MSLAMRFTRAPKGDSLVKQALMSDDSGFSNDDAHAVIDEHPVANPSAGVNLNACEPPCHLAEQPG